MAIAPVSSSSANIAPVDPMFQAFGQLVSAIQSGNLGAAQSAYATVSQSGGGNANGPFAQALSQIGQALQSGDIDQAQQALASLQQQMQTFKGAHHHHHHHQQSDQSQSASAPAGTSGDQTTSTASTNSVDVTA
jgi:hypothetical protein